MKRLRLVKVLVQPVVMIDDGETLTEAATSTVEVLPAELATLAEWLPARLAEQEAELNRGEVVPG